MVRSLQGDPDGRGLAVADPRSASHRRQALAG
jgi:hypothetical protein